MSARRFRDLNVGTGAKEIENVDTVDALAKPTAADVALLTASEPEPDQADDGVNAPAAA